MHHAHQHEKTQTDSDLHSRKGDHSDQPHHTQHGGHDKHAGHNPAMFKRRFFICLLLTLPALYFAPMFEHWFNYQAIQFPGVNWITPMLATMIYLGLTQSSKTEQPKRGTNR